jgi:hypothetical protein
MKVPPMGVLRGGQQFSIAPGIAPSSEPVLTQRTIDSLKAKNFILAPAIVAGDISGQQSVDYLKLGTNQFDAEAIGERLQYQGWRSRAERYDCPRLDFGRDCS